MIEIDGSLGEGGGELLRSALSLSCITGKPFRMAGIRKNRSKPGLMRQHLVAVQSAARISGAEVAGDRVGSAELFFAPGPVLPGEYRFDIGTAGSTSLVLQTLIPPLLRAAAPSRISLTGGTHNPMSPCWHYLAEVFAPALLRIGARIELALDSCGFYPKGGGRVQCRVYPCQTLKPLDWQERGELLRLAGICAVANLPLSIAEREARAALGRIGAVLGAKTPELAVREVPAIGQGTFIFLKGEYRDAVAGFTSLGERGKRAETVGEEAAAEFLAYHATALPVDPHLADQLVLYLAQVGGPSAFATSRITGHLETNLELTRFFLPLDYLISRRPDGAGTVSIEPTESRGPAFSGRRGSHQN